MDWGLGFRVQGRQGKKKKNKVRSTFALPSITIMCTYDFGGVGGFISAPFSILEKRGGLVSFRFIEANWFRVQGFQGLGFHVIQFMLLKTFRVQGSMSFSSCKNIFDTGIKAIVGGHSIPLLPPPNSRPLQKVKGNQLKGRNALTKHPIIRAYYIHAIRQK